MDTNLKNDETIIEVAKTKGKLQAVKICKLLYGINFKDAKDHVDKITEGMDLPKPKISKKGVFIIIALIIIIGFIGKTCDNETASKKDISQTPKLAKTNIDSIINLVKNDKLFEIKDVYYNKSDSSLNIAFTNKGNIIKEKDYSTLYFDKTYHIDSLSCFDGVYLYAYKSGKSLSKGDYKKPLMYNSRRLGRLTEAFDKEYYSAYRATYKPLYDYLKENLNDPSSLEIVKSWNLGMNEDSTFEVKTTFRAKNGFGGLTLQTVNCNIDRKGNVSNVKYNK